MGPLEAKKRNRCNKLLLEVKVKFEQNRNKKMFTAKVIIVS